MSSKKPFDSLSFVKYMKNIGRAYRKQATELVSICRLFVQVGERSFRQDAHLRKVLEVVDDALSSAADPKNKTSGTNKKFLEAIDKLSVYEQKYHPKQQNFTNEQRGVTERQPVTVTERMKLARDNDKYSSGVLNRLKQRFQEKSQPDEGPTKVAQFLLPQAGSLPDPSPNVVKQVLCEKSNAEEIIWNFSRLKDKRITLKQNPRFYRGLPSSAHAYSDCFTTDPIENFWDATNEIQIWVLTDKRKPRFS
ncbi:hypothetical protein BJY52DRAFT_1215514 [Lactarius psammicola]|nr:hypothetical protein BJY52DRAFT_1215514 [Lactarius psammicola]